MIYKIQREPGEGVFCLAKKKIRREELSCYLDKRKPPEEVMDDEKSQFHQGKVEMRKRENNSGSKNQSINFFGR